jgi:hypothetical protein
MVNRLIEEEDHLEDIKCWRNVKKGRRLVLGRNVLSGLMSSSWEVILSTRNHVLPVKNEFVSHSFLQHLIAPIIWLFIPSSFESFLGHGMYQLQIWLWSSLSEQPVYSNLIVPVHSLEYNLPYLRYVLHHIMGKRGPPTRLSNIFGATTSSLRGPGKRYATIILEKRTQVLKVGPMTFSQRRSMYICIFRTL